LNEAGRNIEGGLEMQNCLLKMLVRHYISTTIKPCSWVVSYRSDLPNIVKELFISTTIETTKQVILQTRDLVSVIEHYPKC
jgi:hypothetical protein